MLGYNVSYHVNRAKNPYTTTEFFSTEFQAHQRALELDIASNIDVIIISTFEMSYCGFKVIKGRSNLELCKPDLPDESFNERIKKEFEKTTSERDCNAK